MRSRNDDLERLLSLLYAAKNSPLEERGQSWDAYNSELERIAKKFGFAPHEVSRAIRWKYRDYVKAREKP